MVRFNCGSVLCGSRFLVFLGFLRFAVPSFAVLVGAGHFESSTRTEGCRVGWGCFCSHRSPATQPSSFSHYSGWWLEGGEGGRVTGWAWGDGGRLEGRV